MHDFHAEVCPVEYISPGIDDPAISRQNRLVEVQTIEVERHSRYRQGAEPDTNHRPCSEEEVKGPAVVVACVLEDQSPEVPMSRNDVVGLFLLSEFVSVVVGYIFCRLTYQG